MRSFIIAFGIIAVFVVLFPRLYDFLYGEKKFLDEIRVDECYPTHYQVLDALKKRIKDLRGIKDHQERDEELKSLKKYSRCYSSDIWEKAGGE